MDVFTPSPTPPLPVRRHPPQLHLPPLPVSESTAGLVPAPLFNNQRRFPLRVHVTVQEVVVPQPSSPTLSSDSDSGPPPSSPTASFRSSSSSVVSTTPPSSAPSSPSRRPRALHQAFDVLAHWEPEWTPLPLPTPRRCLRRKPSPKKESLRTLRAKESEACLQRAYDERLEAYLSGDIFQRTKWRDDLGCIEE